MFNSSEATDKLKKIKVHRLTPHRGTYSQPVRLAYQPPASSIFLSQQTSHQQPGSSTFLSEQTSTSNQPPAKRTGCHSKIYSTQWDKLITETKDYTIRSNLEDDILIGNYSLIG
jgi:hypothetical protein